MRIPSLLLMTVAAVLLTGSTAAGQVHSGHSHGFLHDGHTNCPGGVCVNSNSCLTNCRLSGYFGGPAAPDAGWTPPARLPVNRDRAWYQSYVPNALYGNPGGDFIANYPQVYQPTDTTQLGYYYQNVPTWQTRTDMIPPTPNPADFHSRVFPAGYLPGGHAGAAGFHSHSHAYAYMQPQQATRRPQIVRPPIRKDSGSGSRGLFRMSSLGNLLD